MSESLDRWFEHPITVFPHHTDFAGVVWHGTYLTWLEEARVECLQSIGVSFADFVSIGYDFPVIDLSLRYHQSLRLGDKAMVKTQMSLQGVRIKWDNKIQSPDLQTTYVTAAVTLVPIDRQTGKVMRRLPTIVAEALSKILG
jgi:acyl-CoA thioester hydrolase